jgi:hypothetical protein
MKKHNAIIYHAVREAVAAGILRVGKEDKLGRYIDKGDYGTEEMGFLLLFNLLS